METFWSLPLHHSYACPGGGAMAWRIFEAFLNILQAAIAAPKPESMFTTVTPGADEFNAPSNGATPPKAVP